MSADDGVPSSQQVDQLLGSSKLALAIENDKYKHLLDHAPVAVGVSRGSADMQRIVYINRSFEHLMSVAAADVEGQGWTFFDGFVGEDNPTRTLGEAIRDGEDFLGVFRPAMPLDLRRRGRTAAAEPAPRNFQPVPSPPAPDGRIAQARRRNFRRHVELVPGIRAE